MRRLLLLIVTTLVVANAAVSFAQDPVRAGAGVTVAGIDLSGLTAEEARARLDAQLRPRLESGIVLVVAGRDWPLGAAQSRISLDSAATAKLAVGAAPGSAIAPSIGHSAVAVKSWLADIAKKVRREPRDAKLRITLKRIRVVDSKPGKRLPEAALAKQIGKLLDDPIGPRVLQSRLTDVTANVTETQLRRGTVITVSQREFKLRLFKRLKMVKSYKVAVGQPAYPTPRGRFAIANKQVNPVWSVPDSPWAGELAGTKVQGGTAGNPLKARWMGIHDGVGIHGTGQEYSVGSRASHGCIRMRVADVIGLYPRVPVGTPVLIK